MFQIGGSSRGAEPHTVNNLSRYHFKNGCFYVKVQKGGAEPAFIAFSQAKKKQQQQNNGLPCCAVDVLHNATQPFG